jgi:hypothetical protein
MTQSVELETSLAGMHSTERVEQTVHMKLMAKGR